MTVQTLEIEGKRLVLLSQEEFDVLLEKAGVYPSYPKAWPDGSRPAVASATVAIARTVIRRRMARGWTQGELAHRAGVRLETISRLEAGKHAPRRETILRIDGALGRETK